MKITVYELLGMIKDGKAPKKIKYNDYIYTVKGNAIECFVDYCSEEDEWCFNHYIKYENLNDEVEIIEEKKIPDEININLAYIDKEYLLDKEDVDRKINEIINRHNILVDKVSDYLKSKGDE